MYKWDYELHNISINSRFGDAAVNGIQYFSVTLSYNVPDLTNLTAPSNWGIYAPSGNQTFLGWSSNVGTDPNPATFGFPQPIYAVQPGQTVHLSFTTFPRAVKVLDACELGEGGYPIFDHCGEAQKAEVGVPGFSFDSKRVTADVGPVRRRSLACGELAIGELAVPGDPESGLSITEPATPDAVTSAAPSVDPVTTSNIVSDFAVGANSLDLVVLKNSGTVTITGINFQNAAGGDQIRWQIDRDPSDTVDSGTPALNGAPGAQVTFSPTTAGNFRLVAYIDADGSGSFDEGEQVGVLRFAVVQAILQTSSFSVSDENIAGIDTSNQGTSTATTGGDTLETVPMKLSATYLLEGGGAGRTIGTSAITIGNVGNLIGFGIAYPGPTPGTGAESPGGRAPMVDTLNAATVDQGGTAPFRASSQISDGTAASGRVVNLISADRPKFVWRVFHPTTGNAWDETVGGVGFREFVVAFSSTFPRTFLALHQAAWAVTIVGTNEDSVWDDGNGTDMSTITGDSTLQSASGFQVQVLGPSYGKNNSIVYRP